MIYIAHVSASIDGAVLAIRWTIPAEAHPVGLAPATGKYVCSLSDALGAPEGAELVTENLVAAMRSVGSQVAGAWSAPRLF